MYWFLSWYIQIVSYPEHVLASRLEDHRTKKDELFHMLSRRPCASNQCQGRTLTLWRRAKMIRGSASWDRSPNTSTYCTFILESPRKTQRIQALDATTVLLTQRRGRPRLAPIMCVASSQLATQLVPRITDAMQLACVSSSLPQQKDSDSSPVKSEILKGGSVPSGH